VITESVTGITKAAPTPIATRSAISSDGPWTKIAARDASPKIARPAGEHRLPADAIADRAGREQERGERQRVALDDPLELCLRRAGVPCDRR
jgi:hypothetical protein